MERRVKVPVRIVRQELGEASIPPAIAPVTEASPPVVEVEEHQPASPAPAKPPQEQIPSGETELEAWRDRALRLEAEMDNFRKRLQRLADERIASDRERLLRSFLAVADNLARALAADGADLESLRAGVNLTYHDIIRLLDREGAEPVPAQGARFDPTWHEAVGTVPHHTAGVEPDTVVEVVQTGYRIGERLLRPARVIVAA